MQRFFLLFLIPLTFWGTSTILKFWHLQYKYYTVPQEISQNTFSKLLVSPQEESFLRLKETISQENWYQAIRLANEASQLGLNTTSVKTLEKKSFLWKEAIQLLQEIPENTTFATAAIPKIQEYKNYAEITTYNHELSRSTFLEEIATQTPTPSQVFITVCHLSGDCRRLRGNRHLNNPASLIKVPIAFAVMEKVITEKIDLETPIKVNRFNYTEDASDIIAGKTYSLQRLLDRMISQSSNIATNQFIDYLTWDYIHQTLKQKAYLVTDVASKLSGQTTFPPNAGFGPNITTTDELTEMMREIYVNPEYTTLEEILAEQKYRRLGYEAVEDLDVVWLGEKTGNNSEVVGTTVALEIAKEIYIMTVVINHSTNETAIRLIVQEIANHILQQGHL